MLIIRATTVLLLDVASKRWTYALAYELLLFLSLQTQGQQQPCSISFTMRYPFLSLVAVIVHFAALSSSFPLGDLHVDSRSGYQVGGPTTSIKV